MTSADPPHSPDDAERSAAEPDGSGEPDWNPQGLDLARAVAASIGSSNSLRPTRRRQGTGRKGRRKALDRLSRSGAGPDDRDPQLLDSAIDRLVADRGWSTDVAVAGAIARWEQVVGPEVAAHCRAERYADAELTVRTDSTAWATQVRLLAPTVVKRLNEELGDGTVRRIVVVGPEAPSWRKGPRTVRDGRGPRDTYG